MNVKLFLSMTMLVVIMGCPKNIEGGQSPTEVGGLDSQLDIPYFLLDMQNWVDFDPARPVDSMRDAFMRDGEVMIHHPSVIAWANNKQSGKFAQLKQSNTSIPITSLAIERYKGISKQTVLFDASAEASLGVSALGSTSAGVTRYYAFDADLVSYKAKYTFSIMALLRQRLLDRDDFDLRGLPQYYYAFNSLDSNSGKQFNAAAGNNLGFGLFQIGAKGEVKYDKQKTASFRNKVFGVDFFKDSNYNSASIYKNSARPLNVINFMLYDLPNDDVLLESSEEALSWFQKNPERRKIRRFILNDAGAQKRFDISWWEAPPPSPQMQQVENLVTVKVDDKPNLTESTLVIDGGVTNKIESGKTSYACIYDEPEDSRSPYNCDVVFFQSRESLRIVSVERNWKTRKSFVEFVK